MEQTILTEHLEKLLFQIPLFKDLALNVKSSLLDKLEYNVYDIKKKDIILKQNTDCKHLYILLEGKLEVNIIDALGNDVFIEYIVASRAFATPHLFKKDTTLPATFTVVEDGVLFTATKESVFKLISENPDLLKSFLAVSGNCNKCTVLRLRALSHKTVRCRFIAYLFEQRSEDNDIIEIEHNQVQLAGYLCVTRPALTKEINKMTKEGLISMNGRIVHLLDTPRLHRCIL